MSLASFKTAGWRSRGSQVRRRPLLPLCLLALTHFSFLFLTASASETQTAEVETAVKDDVVVAQEPPAVEPKKTKKTERKENLEEEKPPAAAGKKKSSAQYTKWIKTGGVAAAAILFACFFMGIAKRAEKRREAEEDRKRKDMADLARFANLLTDLKADLAAGGDALADMNHKFQEIISQIDQKLDTIEDFQDQNEQEPQEE